MKIKYIIVFLVFGLILVFCINDSFGLDEETIENLNNIESEKINWLANLHAIVVIGYTDNQVITTDSLTGTIRYFDKSTFESRYNAFGKRALYY